VENIEKAGCMVPLSSRMDEPRIEETYDRKVSAIMAGAFSGAFHGCTFNINLKF
jgi:hypothetical protein